LPASFIWNRLYSLPSAWIARSPSSSFLGGSAADCHLHRPLLGKLLQVLPAERLGELEGRGHDGAAVARMRLDHLAGPFRIEQVGVTLGASSLFTRLVL
jgi:hypothetical protein